MSNSSVFYVYALTCLDTFNYGKYLSVPTEELNRRVYPLAKDEKFYREITIYNFLGITKSPLSWQMVKWFGPHRVSIYVPDNNYLKWLMQVFMYGSFNERFYSVNGAIGFFGSASTIQHDFILLKNQP
ncbi:hypothetical protein SDC9_146902 [bioreactor metagenome]|uniref:Uncharacterized protein n=1 Tax=bioreactor metagenome TaxID=1076179 RepID=A0A645EF21_9ZZZZ